MADGRTNKAAQAPTQSGNRVLDVFLKEAPGVQSALQSVNYEAGHMVYRQDKPMFHVYFPVVGSLALTISMRDGSGCEATAIGNEGFLGLPIYYGLSFSPYIVVQQIDGRSMRLAANVFLESVRKSPMLQKLMNRYSAYTQRFAHQTAACNTLHSIRQRACRWLLMVQDRAGTEQFELPQALLADMLGVRRQSVSEVAADLRRRGLIAYRRGFITIANRRKLEAAACCECYGVMNSYYTRMLTDAA
jgi:CRP-like cAMP-binding protein